MSNKVACIPMATAIDVDDEAPSNPNKSWLTEKVAPENLHRFVNIVKKVMFDPQVRLKLYLSGPEELYDWQINQATSVGLLAALVFASTFSSIFNADFATKGASEEEYTRTLTQTIAVFLCMAVVTSAVSVALSVIFLSQGPQQTRKQDLPSVLALLGSYYKFQVVMVVSMCVSVTASIIVVLLWYYVSYTSTLALIMTIIFGSFVLVVYIFYFVRMHKMNQLALVFERHVASGNYALAFKTFDHPDLPCVKEAETLLKR